MTINEIHRINDKIFKKIFENVENVKAFLKKSLPQEIRKRLDFSTIHIDPTQYVSNEFKEGYSDIAVKAEMKSRNGGKIPTEIYFILEHKTEGKVKIFIQILKYMCFVWEQDINANRPLRIIIPIVFYHGENEWNVPEYFLDLFAVNDELRQFLLDFRYILFDTNSWDFRDEDNKELKDNVFVFTAMVLMKAAFKNDMEAILEIFHFWQERGFTQNKEIVLFFLAYISHTQSINQEQLKKMLEESKIHGGELMQTLAQQLKVEEKKETAKRMLDDGLSISTISKYTGLPVEEIEKLMKVSN